MPEHSDGVMIALHPHPRVAELLAVPGGQPAEQLHITLAYLGKVDDLDELQTAALPWVVQQIASEVWRDVDGEVAGVGRFTAGEPPHPFWAAVDVEGLEDLHTEVVEGLRRHGFPVREDHGYTPHITLAYLDPDADDPVEDLPPLRLQFTHLSVVIGEERYDHPLGPSAMMSTSPPLTGPIVRKNDARRLVYGAVLVPGEPDSDGEVLTVEKVEEVAHRWLQDFRAIDRQHAVKAIDAHPVESYITPVDLDVDIDGEDLSIPAGSWVMAAKVADDTTWAEIQARKRTGFSVMGVPRASLEQALASVKSGDHAMLKRVTLADVGGGDPNGEWLAPFVSIVDRPAVPKAKFFAIKSQEQDRSMFERFKSWLQGTDQRPLDGTTAGKARPEEENEMDREEVVAIVEESLSAALKSAVEEATAPITTKLDELETQLGEVAEKDEGGEEDTDPLEAFKSEIGERLDQLAEQINPTAARQLAPTAGEVARKAAESLADDYDAHGRRKRRRA